MLQIILIFVLKKWIYYSTAIELNKKIWVISKTLKSIHSIFKDWTQVYSELHPV